MSRRNSGNIDPLTRKKFVIDVLPSMSNSLTATRGPSSRSGPRRPIGTTRSSAVIWILLSVFQTKSFLSASPLDRHGVAFQSEKFVFCVTLQVVMVVTGTENEDVVGSRRLSDEQIDSADVGRHDVESHQFSRAGIRLARGAKVWTVFLCFACGARERLRYEIDVCTQSILSNDEIPSISACGITRYVLLRTNERGV